MFNSEFTYKLLSPIFIQNENADKETVNEIVLYAPNNLQHKPRQQIKRLWVLGAYRQSLDLASKINTVTQKEKSIATETAEPSVLSVLMIQMILYGCLSEIEIDTLVAAMRDLMLSGSCKVKGAPMTTFNYKLLCASDLENILFLYIQNFFLFF